MDAINQQHSLQPPTGQTPSSEDDQSSRIVTQDIPHNSPMSHSSKIQDPSHTQDVISTQKDSASDKTPKAGPVPLLPASMQSRETRNSTAHSDFSRNPSSSASNTSRQPSDLASGDTLEVSQSANNGIPDISVVPSSPATRFPPNRSVTHLPSMGEPIPEGSSRARESASDRRSNRRRSAIEVRKNALAVSQF